MTFFCSSIFQKRNISTLKGSRNCTSKLIKPDLPKIKNKKRKLSFLFLLELTKIHKKTNVMNTVGFSTIKLQINFILIILIAQLHFGY
ncbi:hypothetical protein DOS84_03590 [Flavobacterium aquariorum]|uniref:Uncharacterized protein n=1 Tax=Flavobacterium aquariorum TaxID=2217670 RepID=A0A2W7U0K4_9FLAO|nr:hypothetical protein DOS84_03590 [Flavobacterium aquariorum]